MLTFETYEKCKQHPQIQSIPEYLWETIFSDQFEIMLQLVCASKEELIHFQPDAILRQKAEATLVAIVFSHPDLDLLLLRNIAAKLQLNKTKLFQLFCLVGNKKYFEGLITEESRPVILGMIEECDYEAYHNAAKGRHLELMQHLETLVPDKIEDMIAAQMFSAYRSAAANGHLEVMKYLESQAPNKVQEMIAADDYDAYRAAAENGHLEILAHLELQVPEQIQAMIAAMSFSAYSSAAKGGHLKIMQHLESLVPDKIEDMIAAYKYMVYRDAAANGNFEILAHLELQVPEQFQAMISAMSFSTYIAAAKGRHLKVMQHLESLVPDKIEDMIAAQMFSAYRHAAANGHIEVMKYLESQAPEKVQEMIAADDYNAYYHAAKNGHLDIVKHLESQAPREILAMIAADDYCVYSHVAAGGHLQVLQHLEAQAPEQILEMIAAYNYSAYRNAVTYGHHAIAQEMLSQSSACLAYAEDHMREYSAIVTPFRDNTLAQLHQAAGITAPQGVFDIPDSEQAKICFYLLRSLIRANDRTRDDDLRFLLSIPSVKALAHQEVTSGRPNELLRLALTTNNEEAASLLLTIPEVNQLAAQNNYYQDERQGALNLAQLARDRESSMTALTEGERRRLKTAITHYKPELDKKGVPNLIDALREQLCKRYQSNPAYITTEKGKQIVLPQNFDDFKQLNCNESDSQKALTAYYQHKDHTAWRYLLKPNPWMHPEAPYVNRSPTGPQSWSTFEEYQSLIAMFWLAASDKNFPLIAGHTLEGRLDHFIDELAHIGRAHNWDRTRTNTQGLEEEYDDLTGDQPSCYSGVKRRLFQSVLGHPLLTMLTEDILGQEMREFAGQHFEEQLQKFNRAQVKYAFDNFINMTEITEENKNLIASFNIPQEKLNGFEMYLAHKYGTQYTDDLNFRKFVENTLALKFDSPEISDHYHALMLDGMVGLYATLNYEKVTEMNNIGFFSPAQSQPGLSPFLEKSSGTFKAPKG